jgi:glutamine synthetase
MFGYSVLRASLNHDFFREIMTSLGEFKVPIEGLHTETGPGVYEAAIEHGSALESADRAALFKTSVKELGYRHGILPTFMAKWHEKLPGCSGHLHQSLWDKDNKKNLFFDNGDGNKMSDLFRHYLAGQMACLPEILPMFAPNINSYKRLVEGLWAPTRVTWGIDNRTVALRVIPGSAKSTRLETRVPGSDTNPYLAIAAALASGLYGIQNKLELKTSPIQGNGYAVKDAVRLPGNLISATERMANSDIAKELFGEAFVEHFVASRRWEWDQFEQNVTDFERNRYFELV